MKIHKVSVCFFAILAIAGIIMFNGCEKDREGKCPELPPLKSFFIDFSDFGNSSDTLITKKTLPCFYNWTIAFGNVAFWNSVITIGMTVPVAAYSGALAHAPVYQGDNQWEWKYNVTVNNIIYFAKLRAWQLSNEQFAVEMYISQVNPGGFTDFKWFEGVVRYDHTQASWTLYESPLTPEKFLSIEWNYNCENNLGDITYTIIKASSPEKNSYISYVVDYSNNFNSSYTISLSSDFTEIEWNVQTKNGRVKSTKWFNDNSWHCWNQYLQNDDCEFD